MEKKAIQEIDLSKNNLTELDDLSEYKNLKVLDASCNDLLEISGIGSNTELRELKLYGNKIKSISHLDKLSELNTLLVHDNKITAIGKGLMYCHKLQTLRLDHNQLGGVWSGVELASCSAHLSELDLSYNKLIGVEAVAALPNLTDLNLSGNTLQLAPEVGQCAKLKCLNLSHNPLQSCSLSKLIAPNLKILHLSSVKLTYLDYLPHLPSVQDLHLSHNDLSSLEKCPTLFPSLELLDVRWNKLQTIEALCPLVAAKRLTELMVNENGFCMKDEVVHTSIREMLPNVEVMNPRTIIESVGSMKAEKEVLASTTPEIKELEQALIESDQLLQNYKSQITASFRMLQPEEDQVQTQAIPRQPSRSGNRARLQEALEFAAQAQSKK